MEARNKLESEALLEEQKVILGWLIDFRHLLICLPENKFVAWSEAIRKMIKDEFSTAKDIARSPGPSHTICTSLHEATEGPTYNRQKETLRQNQLRMPKRPRDVPRISKNCKGWDQSQHHCIPETNSHLQVRLVPYRIRRIQRQRLGVEMVPSKKISSSVHRTTCLNIWQQLSPRG